MRSIADQSVEQLGGQGSVLVRMRREHRAMDTLLERLAKTTGQEQDEVLTRLWRLVFTHAYAEETLLWPAIRKVADDGEEVTCHVEQGHQKLSELVAALEQTRPGDPRRGELLEEMAAELRLDAREEEDILLPRLQRGMSPRQLRRLGLAWTVVRRTAPTRPHVAISRQPPANVLAAVPLSLLDRSRDALDRSARREGSRAASLAAGASRGLARIAGAVERLRLVHLGEPSRTRPGQWAVHRDHVATRDAEGRRGD